MNSLPFDMNIFISIDPDSFEKLYHALINIILQHVVRVSRQFKEKICVTTTEKQMFNFEKYKEIYLFC